jgi:hypothetical protein
LATKRPFSSCEKAPATRQARQADEVADSRQAPKGATIVPAILRGAAKSRRRRAFGEHREGLTP